MLDGDGGRIELAFRRVPVDIDTLIEAYCSSGRPFADDAIADYGG